MSYCIILTLTSSIEEAKKIAHAVVKNRLAACANIIPNVTSVELPAILMLPVESGLEEYLRWVDKNINS